MFTNAIYCWANATSPLWYQFQKLVHTIRPQITIVATGHSIDISNLGPSEENHDLWREIVDSNDSLHISPNMFGNRAQRINRTSSCNFMMNGVRSLPDRLSSITFTGFEGKQELSPIQLIQPSISTLYKSFKNTRKSCTYGILHPRREMHWIYRTITKVLVPFRSKNLLRSEQTSNRNTESCDWPHHACRLMTNEKSHEYL